MLIATPQKQNQTPLQSKKSVGFFFQPKLTINQPNYPDSYRDEQEADAMAEEVMHITNNENTQQPFFKPAISVIQRKCAHCEEEEKKMQRRENNSEITDSNQKTFTQNEAVSFFNPVIQPKLTINQPNDPDSYRDEQEADRVADQVMRMPEPTTGHETQGLSRQVVPQIQRMCTDCEEEEAAVPQVQRKCGSSADEEIHRMAAEEEEEEAVQRKSGDSNQIEPKLESGLIHLGGGQPLPDSVRSFFEPRFGQSFIDVRVHTGAAANRAARSINAKAFTLGNNIAFARGEHDFNSDSGRRLMAHELTHTLQQSAGAKSVQRGSAGIFGGKCCLRSPRVEWALVGAGVWKNLRQGQCTGITEDCDGMTCGGGFYHVDNGQTGNCSTPRSDDPIFAPRRWTPTSTGASAHSPTAEGSTGGDTPPNYVYDSAATTACPSGIRTISVDFVTLDGATTSATSELASANRLYSGCCIQFVAGATPPKESPATTQSWLGGDRDLKWHTMCGVEPEEQAMWDGATSKYGLASRMRVFLVDSLTPTTAAGYSKPPFCATGSAAPYLDHVVLSNSVSATTNPLAHEFGHILLNSGNHTTSPNLMAPSGGTTLSPTDCATAFANA